MTRIDERVSRKRLIFTAATGRCGTGYLARMLNMLGDVDARHEPAPDFSQVMRAAQTDRDVAHRFWIEQKLPEIARSPASVYIETSHLLCKGFWEPLEQLGIAADLIVLTRPAREVASSLFRLNTIPGRTPQGLQYYLSPNDPVSVELPEWKALHDYQLCYWYCLEIERRQTLYEQSRRARGGRVVTTSLAEITDRHGLERLARRLELPIGAWSTLRWFTGSARVVNKKRRGNRPLPPAVELDQFEADVRNRVELRPRSKTAA